MMITRSQSLERMSANCIFFAVLKADLLVMAGLDSTKRRTIFLIEKIIHNSDLGVTAALIGIIDRERRTAIPDSHPRISAVAPNIRILALRGCRSLMGSIIDIGCGG
jgi:hypothetical protein